MKLYFVVCVLVHLAAAENTYRAAIVRDGTHNSDLNTYIPAIYEAGRKNVDILVLPSSDTVDSEYNYDESVKNIAKAARVSRVYVAAHLREGRDRVPTSLVFDRDGAVVALYRNPSHPTNHTAEEVTFQSDFDVHFTVLMDEELALERPPPARNVLVTGNGAAEIAFLNAGQLGGAWSLVTGANVVTPTGIHGGAATTTEHLLVADLHKRGRTDVPPPVVSPSPHTPEDLSQYIVKPLDEAASVTGYIETVCHHKFCCQFKVKASFKGTGMIQELLAVFDGVRHFGHNKYVGSQTCAIFACAGLYKRTCDLGAQNNVIFEQISISGNFSHNSIQFPMVVSHDVISYTISTTKQTTITANDVSVITFGIFGRDYSRDHEAVVERQAFEDSQGIFNENVQEFIDYVWIRLRILIFVVSIYILEMM